MTLIVFTLGWLVGLWLGDLWHIPLYGAGSVIFCGVLGVATKRRWQFIGLASIAVIGMGCGIGRYALVDLRPDANHISMLAGRTVQIEGIIKDEPRWTADGQRIVLESTFVKRNNQVVPTHGLVQVELAPEPQRQRGERVLIQGNLMTPKHGRGFDYAEYLSRRAIFVLMRDGTVLQATPPAASFRASLLTFKYTVQRVILRIVPEPQASLLIGILLGIQSSVPQSMWQDFNRTGTSHILVISGWNISIIVVSLLAVAQKLGWRTSVGVGVALSLIVVYVLLVGASASVVRAAVMGAIVALAEPLRRRSDPWTALAAACVVMTAYEPNTLWDLGFQLSAVATASLFAWSTRVEKFVRLVVRGRWLKWMIEPLTATLAAQIWTLPIILYTFGNLSLIAPVANVLMVPVVPFAMAAGAALASLGVVWRWLGMLLLPLAWVFLSWLIWIAHTLAATEWAAITLPPFAVGWIIGFYVVSIGLWIWLQQRIIVAAERDAGATLSSPYSPK